MKNHILERQQTRAKLRLRFMRLYKKYPEALYLIARDIPISAATLTAFLEGSVPTLKTMVKIEIWVKKQEKARTKK